MNRLAKAFHQTTVIVYQEEEFPESLFVMIPSPAVEELIERLEATKTDANIWAKTRAEMTSTPAPPIPFSRPETSDAD